MYHHRDICVAYDGTSRSSYGQEIIHCTPPKIKVVDGLSLSKSGDGTSPKNKVLDALLPNTKNCLLQIHHHAIPVPLVMVMSSMIPLMLFVTGTLLDKTLARGGTFRFH